MIEQISIITYHNITSRIYRRGCRVSTSARPLTNGLQNTPQWSDFEGFSQSARLKFWQQSHEIYIYIYITNNLNNIISNNNTNNNNHNHNHSHNHNHNHNTSCIIIKRPVALHPGRYKSVQPCGPEAVQALSGPLNGLEVALELSGATADDRNPALPIISNIP